MCTWWIPLKEATTRKKGDGTGDRPPEKQSKRWHKCRPKPRLDKNPAIEQDQPVDDEKALEQPSEQGNTDRETEHPSSGENGMPDDLTPNKPMEQKNLHERLVATARSLKKAEAEAKNSGRCTPD